MTGRSSTQRNNES